MEHVLGNSSHTQSQIHSGLLAAHPSGSLAPPDSPPPPHNHSCLSPRVATRAYAFILPSPFLTTGSLGAGIRRVEIVPMSYSTPPNPRQASPQQVQQMTWLAKTSRLPPIRVLSTVSWELVAHALQVGPHSGPQEGEIDFLTPSQSPTFAFCSGL